MGPSPWRSMVRFPAGPQHNLYLTARTCSLHASLSCPAADAREPSSHSDKQRLASLKHHMLLHGWCLHQVEHLSRLHSLDVFEYLATRARSPQRFADHEPCRKQSGCVAYNTCPSTYETRHVEEDCQCLMVATPDNRLIEIIRSEGIPLLSIKGGTEANPTFTLHPEARNVNSSYVAVSHVWFDGLGNPFENALPACQIRRLQAYLQLLVNVLETYQEPLLFWMDTLCIPARASEWPLRLMQIDKMASIYKGSISTLVLDAELMATNLDCAMLTAETRARIACSVWMCRSWTFQEGQLPPALTVQFKDRAVVLGRNSLFNGTYFERVTRKIQPSISDVPLGPGASTVRANGQYAGQVQDHTTYSLRNDEDQCVDIALQCTLFSTFFTESLDFVSVWNELAGRSTSKSEDVPLIITNLLDMDNWDLLQYHDAGEMFQRIILSLERPPLSLFFHFGPRQDPDGNHHNRWTPSKIAPEQLSSKAFMTAKPRHFLYEYTGQEKDTDVSVFIVDSLMPLGPELYARLGDDEIVYDIETSAALRNDFDTTDYISTCIILEKAGPSNGSTVRRGACFYILYRNAHAQGNRNWMHRPKPFEIEMAFITSIRLRLRQGPTPDLSAVDSTRTYHLEPMEHQCKLKIRFDPPPDFKRLKNRDFRTLLALTRPLRIVFLIGFALSTLLTFWLIASFGDDHKGSMMLIFGFMIALMAFSVLCFLYWSTNVVARWRYVESFEDVASSRP